MNEAVWKVYWNEYVSDTYLYGSEISLQPDKSVLYKNRLMPPGTILKTWCSKTNYQVNRIEPALPIIDGEAEYQIYAKIDYPESGSCILRLVFYDKFDAEISSMTMKQSVFRFRCPLQTFSYRIQLMNAGTSALHFYYMIIKEVGNSNELE